ncbi:MAG: thiamine phosphate synthase [Candidatus Zixiibacteriota bacterium]
MNKKELLSKIQLYVIADKEICGKMDIEEVVTQAIEGGAEMVQYRDKESDDDNFLETAAKLQAICNANNIPFIVNDRVEIAKKMDADGVHVGQEDMPLAEVKRKLNPAKIIGVSATSIEQAMEAERGGADYVGVGPIFDTSSKKIDKPLGLDLIRETKDNLSIPFFAIGGINLNNLDGLILAGGIRIAVISALVLSNNVKFSAAELLKKLKTASNTY